MPSETPGTDSVTSRGTWHCPRRILIIRRASTSLRGALTEAHPRYVSWLNTTLSSSGMGLTGLPSDDDSSAAMWQWIGQGVEKRTEKKMERKGKGLFCNSRYDLRVAHQHYCLYWRWANLPSAKEKWTEESRRGDIWVHKNIQMRVFCYKIKQGTREVETLTEYCMI